LKTQQDRVGGLNHRVWVAALLAVAMLGGSVFSSSSPAQAAGPCDIGGVSVSTVASQPECDALIALYNSTDGPNWTNSTGWNTATDPCTWFGVTCNDAGVTELRLTRNALSGEIPMEFGDLANLTTVYFFGNELSGEIPIELGELSNLALLDLSENEL